MKDPLQRRETPYEVLGIGLAATPDDINRAFQLKLAARGNVQKLTAARQVLGRPIDRALIDLFDYRDALFDRLRPNPRTQPDALGSERREATAASWIKALRSGFPDPALAHGLGILHYWWALTETEKLAESPIAQNNSVYLENLWEMAIGCWSSALTDPGFWRDWPGIPAVLHEELRSQIRQRLSGDLHRLARKFHEAGNAGVAKRLERLDLRCDDEIETAKAMLAAKLNTNRGNLCAGKLLLDRLELTPTVSSSVESALQRLPGDRNLTFLRQALGSYSEIWFLLRRDQFDLAMEAIDRLSSEKRKAGEVRTLECKALQGQGSQLAALGKVSEALDRWELALAKADSGEERESLRDKIEKSLGEVAAKVSGKDARDSAIDLLERGETMLSRARTATSPDFKLRLAELHCVRGIEIINQAQEEFNADRVGKARAVRRIDSGIADLARASELGLERAEAQRKTALEIREAMQNWVPPPDPELLQRHNSAVQRANKALEDLRQRRIDVRQAITLLQRSITELDQLASGGLDQARESAVELRKMIGQLQKAENERSAQPAKKRFPNRLAGLSIGVWEIIGLVSLYVFGLVGAAGFGESAVQFYFLCTFFAAFNRTQGFAYIFMAFYALVGVGTSAVWLYERMGNALEDVKRSVISAPQQQASAVEAKSTPSLTTPAGRPADKDVKSSATPVKPTLSQSSSKGPQPSCPDLKTWARATELAEQSNVLGGLHRFSELSADCRNKALLATAELAASLPSLKPEFRHWATLLAAASFEALGDEKKALALYQVLSTLDGELSVTGRVRSVELAQSDRKAVEQLYRDLRAAPIVETWFKTPDGWQRASTHRAANLGLLTVRGDDWSIKQFERWVHWFTPSPHPHRYLFVMLGLILMLVLLDLPLAIWSERVSAVTATLQHSINSIQQAHAGNPLEVQRRIAALYALHGVKPGLGCLGVMVEWLMYGAALYLFSDWVPRLELDQARFLWVSDLVRPDNGIVLIWCAIAILAGYITFKRRNLAVAGQRFAAALVPLMIAGLAWYYTWPAYGMLAWALLLLSLVLSRGIVRGFVARRA